jgi:Cft2 family RNA processing exonuclease
MRAHSRFQHRSYHGEFRPEKLRVGFSGDLGRKGKPILRDPVPIPPVEHLVMESTYGDRLHEISGDILAALARIVRETASQGGKIIIPAFAVERTQDLIFYLHLLTDEKKIPDIPVYVDSPMAVNATAIFKNHPECYDDDTKKAFIEHHTNPSDSTPSLYRKLHPVQGTEFAARSRGDHLLERYVRGWKDPTPSP